MGQTIIEDLATSAFAKRSAEIREANMCRLCFKKRYLINIAADEGFMARLKECLPHIDSGNEVLPRFVCEECYQAVDAMFRFCLRSSLATYAIQMYISNGEQYPDASMVDEVQPKASEIREEEQNLVKSKLDEERPTKAEKRSSSKTRGEDQPKLKRRRSGKKVSEDVPKEDNRNVGSEKRVTKGTNNEKRSPVVNSRTQKEQSKISKIPAMKEKQMLKDLFGDSDEEAESHCF